MDPASFQPGSAPIEYQVQVPSSSPSIHDSSYLSRPSSRLGFSEATSLETIASSAQCGPADLLDTRPESNQSLNQDGSLPALRLSTLLSGNSTVSDSPAASCSLDSPKTTGRDASTDKASSDCSNATVEVIKTNSTDSDCLYGGQIDRASSAPVTASMSGKPRPSSTPSVSRLCFPFVTSASRRKKAPPVPPPTRHKYSCGHPTLMAPYHAGKVFPVHQRHQYSHHGPSRQGMERLRAFWSGKFVQDLPAGQSESSEDERSKAQARLAALYDMDHTVVEMPATIHPLASEEAHNAQHKLPPMTVHPRRGDIMALRDPYCMQIDRQFVNLPTWTIGKTIWMQDVHIASEKQQAENAQVTTFAPQPLSASSSDRGEEEDADSQDEDGASTDAESEIDVETCTSTGFSDDSDATLVESESEADLPLLVAAKAGNAFYQWASEGSSSSRRPTSSSQPTVPAGLSRGFASVPSPISTSSSDINYSLHPSPLSDSRNSSISDTIMDTKIDVDLNLSSWSQTFYTSNLSRESLSDGSSRHQNEVEDDDAVLSMTPPTTPTAPRRSSTPVRTCTPSQSWQTSWYCRWELLVDLTKKDRDHKHCLRRSCPTTPATEGFPLKGQKFFFNSAPSDDEDENDGPEQDWRIRTRGRAISA